MRIKVVDKESNKSAIYNYNEQNNFYDLKQFIIEKFENFTNVDIIDFETIRPSKKILAENNNTVQSLLPSGSMCVVSQITKMEERKTQQQPQQWHCYKCTLINEGNTNICIACGATNQNNNNNNNMKKRNENNNNDNRSSSSSSYTPSSSSKSNERSQNQSLNAVRRIIPSDNSCLFNSIAYILEGRRGKTREKTTSTSIATRLRERVALTVTNGKEWTPAVLGMSKTAYVNYIKNMNRWGGGIECNIFANIYHVEVCAIDIQTKQRYCFGESKGYKRRAFLLYTGTHYDALTFTKKGKNSKDEDTDVCILDLPIPQYVNDDIERLVDQMRAAKQFTNLGNFNTQCCICYKKFQGQKGVIEHAQATGHQNYSEIPTKNVKK